MSTRKNGGSIGLLILVIAAFMATRGGSIPGFTGSVLHGGKGYHSPVPAGASPWRIDQGVDYNGPVNLYALGSGDITSLYSAGWPGGVFIKLHLDSGAYKGRYVYYAEQLIPVAGLGHVSSGQLIARCRPVHGCVEIGWGVASADTTMARSLGQAAAGEARGDAGRYPTACGIQFNDLIRSLGGPGGLLLNGPVQGSSC